MDSFVPRHTVSLESADDASLQRFLARCRATGRMPDWLPEFVLELGVEESDAGGVTVRSYLVRLLAAFWSGDADGKWGMTGSSGWRMDLYGPLRDAGLVPVWKEGYSVGSRVDGTDGSGDLQWADDLIGAAIRALEGAGR